MLPKSARCGNCETGWAHAPHVLKSKHAPTNAHARTGCGCPTSKPVEKACRKSKPARTSNPPTTQTHRVSGAGRNECAPGQPQCAVRETHTRDAHTHAPAPGHAYRKEQSRKSVTGSHAHTQSQSTRGPRRHDPTHQRQQPRTPAAAGGPWARGLSSRSLGLLGLGGSLLLG